MNRHHDHYVPSAYLVPSFPRAVRTARRPLLSSWFGAAALVLAFGAGMLVAGDRAAAPAAQVDHDSLACSVRIETQP